MGEWPPTPSHPKQRQHTGYPGQQHPTLLLAAEIETEIDNLKESADYNT